ncbi:MAG TPA: RHS repeat-associated core domain-containing protein [Gammaproteobacteria bacterium]
MRAIVTAVIVSSILVVVSLIPAHADSTSTIWVAGANGAYEIETSTGEIIATIPTEMPVDAIQIEPSSGAIWMLSNNRLLIYSSDSEPQTEISLPVNGTMLATLLAIDTESASVWVADPQNVFRFSIDGSLVESWLMPSTAFVQTITPTPDGTLWLAGDATVWRIADGNLEEAFFSDDLSIRGMAVDPVSGDLWLAGGHGVRLYDTSGTLREEIPLPAGINAMRVTVDAAGAWIGGPFSAVRLNAAHETVVSITPFSDITSPWGYPVVTTDVTGSLPPGHVWMSAADHVRLFAPDGTYSKDLVVPAAGIVNRLAEYRDNTPPEIRIDFPPEATAFNDPKPMIGVSFEDEGSGINATSLRFSIDAQSTAFECDSGEGFANCQPVENFSEESHYLTVTISDKAGNVSAPAELNFIIDLTSPSAPPAASIDVQFENGFAHISAAAGSVEPGTRITITNLRTSESVTVSAGLDGSFSASLAGAEGDTFEITVSDAAGNVSEPIERETGSVLPPDPATIAPPIPSNEHVSFHDSIRFLYEHDTPVQSNVVSSALDENRTAVLRGRVLDASNEPVSGVRVSIVGIGEFGETLTREDGRYDMVVNGGAYVAIQFKKEGYLSVQRKENIATNRFHEFDGIVILPLDERSTVVQMGATEQQLAIASTNSDADGARTAKVYFPRYTQAELVLPDGSRQRLEQLTFRATEYTVGENGPAAMPGTLPPTTAYTYAVELSADEAIAAGAVSVEFNQSVSLYVDNFLDFPVGTIVPVGWYDRENAAWVPSENGIVLEVLGQDAITGWGLIDVDGDGEPERREDYDVETRDLWEFGISDSEADYLGTNFPPGTKLWRAPVTHFTPYDLNWLRGSLSGNGPPRPPFDPDPSPPNIPELNSEDATECEGCILEVESGVVREAIHIPGTPFNLAYRSRPHVVSGNPIVGFRMTWVPRSSTDPRIQVFRPRMSLFVNGRLVDSSPAPLVVGAAAQLVWNQRDAYGRTSYGPHNASLVYSHETNVCYDGVLLNEAELQMPIFGVAPIETGPMGNCRLAATYRVERKHDLVLNGMQKSLGKLAGWNLSPLHSYKPNTRELLRGDGTIRKGIPTPTYRPWQMIETVTTPTDSEGISIGDAVGLPFSDVDLSTVHSATYGPDGTLYLTCGECVNTEVFYIDSDGIVRVYLDIPDEDGNTRELYFGDDGILYVQVDWDSHRELYRVRSPDDVSQVHGYRREPKEQLHGEDQDFHDLADSVFPFYGFSAVNSQGWIFAADNTFGGVNSAKIYVVSDGEHADDWATIPEIVRFMAFDDDGNLIVAASDYLAPWRVYRFLPDRRQDWIGLPDDDFQPEIVANLQGVQSAKFTDGRLVMHRILIESGVRTNIIEAFSDTGGHETLTDPAYQAACAETVGEAETGLMERTCFSPQMRLLAVKPTGDLLIAESSNTTKTIRKTFALDPRLDQTIADSSSNQAYQFDARGFHLSTLDFVTGRTLYRFEYYPDGTLSAVVDDFGNRTTVEPVASGFRITSPDGHITNLVADESGMLTKLILPGSREWRFDYASESFLTYVRDPNGNESHRQYDSAGRFISDRWPNNGGWFVEKEWNPDLPLQVKLRQTSGEGRATEYIDEVKESTGKYWRELTTVRPDETRRTRELRAGLVRTEDNGVTHSVFQTRANPSSHAFLYYPHLERISFGSKQREIRKTRHIELSGTAPHPWRITEWRDVTLVGREHGTHYREYESKYQTVPRRWTHASPHGRATNIDLNTDFLPETIYRTGLASSHLSYDERGRLESITAGEGAATRTTSYSYHPLGDHQAGYLASVTDALGRSVQFEYDFAGRINVQRLPDGRTVSYEYDANNNVLAITPPGRLPHGFTHTIMDQQGSYTPPPLGEEFAATHYLYNLDKQLELVTRSDGQTIDFIYGSVTGKLDALQVSNGAYVFDYSPETGRLTSLTAPGGETLAYGYEGFLVTSIASAGTINGTVGFDYDDNFWSRGVTVNGVRIDYDYDQDGLVTRAGDMSITRDGIGLPDTASLGVVATDNNVNTFGELDDVTAAVSGADIYEVDYERDKLGRITRKIETVEGVTTTYDYTYDLAGRLDTVSENGTQVRNYEYDSNGNRTHINGGLVGTYDDQDRLLSREGCSYQYTGNGELDTRTCDTETLDVDYDVLGNLRHAELPDGTQIDYVIDGQNRRIGKKVNGELAQGFLYQDQLNPVAELNGVGNVVARFIYVEKPHVPSYMLKGGNTYRIISDHLGSPRLVIDTVTGEIVQRMEYDVWGNVILDTNPGFQPFGFAGGVYDRDTGLTRFGARDYDPVTGRWTAKDPKGLYGGLNVYAYAENDPINRFDIFGMEAASATAAVFIPKFPAPPPALACAAAFGAGYAAGTYLYDNFLQDPIAELVDDLFLPAHMNESQDKKLTKGEIDKLTKGGTHPHDLKDNSRQDLFKDGDGNIVVKPKDGSGPGDPTGLNINDF